MVKTMKVCRKYLTHVQRSVFEGEITEGNLVLLKEELKGIVNKKKDFVIVYSMKDTTKMNRDIITDTHDPLDNFI